MRMYTVCGIHVWCVYKVCVCVCLQYACVYGVWYTCVVCVYGVWYTCVVCVHGVCVRGVVRTQKGELSDCSFPPSFVCAVLGFDTDRSWQSAQHTERVRCLLLTARVSWAPLASVAAFLGLPTTPKAPIHIHHPPIADLTFLPASYYFLSQYVYG